MAQQDSCERLITLIVIMEPRPLPAVLSKLNQKTQTKIPNGFKNTAYVETCIPEEGSTSKYKFILLNIILPLLYEVKSRVLNRV